VKLLLSFMILLASIPSTIPLNEVADFSPLKEIRSM